METGEPRTLAEDLRARDDEALARLLRARPDLLTPVPNDLTQLATRAATRASVLRALDQLPAFPRQVAEALAVAPDPCPYPTLRTLMAGSAPRRRGGGPVFGEPLPAELVRAVEDGLAEAVAALRDCGMVWGAPERVRLVRAGRDALGPSVGVASGTGLGPSVGEATAGMSPARMQQIVEDAGLPATHDPVSAIGALTGLFADPAALAALLDGAPEEARAVLDRLVWGPPYGEVRDALGVVRAADAATPVQWLLARGLLLPAGPHNVVLPREAALTLRGGRAHRTPEPLPPEVVPVPRAARTVDPTAAGQALAAVSTVTELLTAWETGGPPVLRAGGLSVRDLKRTAAVLDLPEPQAAFWLELAYAAGLIAADGEVDEVYAPTPAADEWSGLPAHERWGVLAAAWLVATRTPGLVGTRDPKGRALAALGPDLDRPLAPQVRRRVLELLAGLPPGSAADHDALPARLRWDRPLRPGADALRADLLRWTLQDAEALGVTGRGALAAHARPLLEGDVSAAAAALAPLLPEPLDHVLLQADLTAVAPGPLAAPLAEMLGVLADVESKGGATVYRFTPESVRRALDAGRSAAEVQAFLAAHSRTPVPQPLSYLVDDVARRHGTLRVGAAAAYLRCDDDSLLTELLADRRANGLGLRRLAPTVLAAQADPTTLLERLRAMGLAPAAESADGDVLITRPDARRTPRRTPPAPVTDGPPVPDDTLLGLAVKTVRAGDRAATAPRRAPAPRTDGPPRSASADTLATMQAATLAGESLWIGYVNAEGTATQRVIAPVRVEGGYVTAYDHTADEVRTFALHRVTGVSALSDDPA